jgi:hypothetical protein
MAAGRLAEPGTVYGPCADDCAHTDCDATRSMALALCDVCGRAVGYDTRFYRREPALCGTILRDSVDNAFALVHARCVEP